MNLGTQVISAGAASVGLFSELARLTADQRSKLREVMEASCEIQGSATLADGTAQKAALDQEADIRGTMASQSFAEAGTTLGGELASHAMEAKIGSSKESNLSQNNLKFAEGFESTLNGTKSNDAVIRLNTPAETEMLPMVASKTASVTKKSKEYSAEELEGKEFSLTDSYGKMKDPTALEDHDKALFEHLLGKKGSPELELLRKQVTKSVKLYRTQTDSVSSKQGRVGEQMKHIIRAGGAVGKGLLDLNIKACQTIEANEKLTESTARYLSDTNGSLLRQSGEVAGNLTNHIQNINQALKGMFDSNQA